MKQQLRQEMEDTRKAYHRLLDEIQPEDYNQPSDNPAWTIGEVLYHMSLAPRMIGTDVRMIRNQSWLLPFVEILVPKKLFDWLNKYITRYGARHPSRQFLADQYDRAHAAALRSLDSVPDQVFSKSLHYPDWDPLLSGDVNLERLFHYIKDHFELHAKQLRMTVSKGDQPEAPPVP